MKQFMFSFLLICLMSELHTMELFKLIGNKEEMDVVKALGKMELEESMLNIQNAKGETPLMYTIKKDYRMVARELVWRGADLNKYDKKGRTALHEAALMGAESLVSFLITQGALIDKQDNQGKTALYDAILTKDGYLVSSLIKEGSSLSLKDIHGATPLALAVENNLVSMVELLLEFPATPINSQDDYLGSPLHTAVWYGQLGMVRELLKHQEINVNIKNADGDTPLYYAILWGDELLTSLLLSHGACPFSCSRTKDALSLATHILKHCNPSKVNRGNYAKIAHRVALQMQHLLQEREDESKKTYIDSAKEVLIALINTLVEVKC